MSGHFGPHFSIKLSQVLHFQEPRGYLTGFSPAQVCGFISQIPTIRLTSQNISKHSWLKRPWPACFYTSVEPKKNPPEDTFVAGIEEDCSERLWIEVMFGVSNFAPTTVSPKTSKCWLKQAQFCKMSSPWIYQCVHCDTERKHSGNHTW